MIELIAANFDPANKGVTKVKHLKEVEMIRLAQALVFYASTKNTKGH